MGEAEARFYDMNKVIWDMIENFKNNCDLNAAALKLDLLTQLLPD